MFNTKQDCGHLLENNQRNCSQIRTKSTGIENRSLHVGCPYLQSYFDIESREVRVNIRGHAILQYPSVDHKRPRFPSQLAKGLPTRVSESGGEGRKDHVPSDEQNLE